MTSLLRIDEAAERLGVAPQTLRNWRVQGVGPRSAKIGGRLVYLEDELESYIEAQFQLSSHGGTR